MKSETRKTLFNPKPERRLELLPSGIIQPVDVYRASVPTRPAFLVCDCCLSHVDRIWGYRQRGFCERRGRRKLELVEGWWAFCVYCNALWVRKEMDLLIARVITLNPDLDGDWLKHWYPDLVYVLHGEPQEWHSGQAYPDLMP